MKTAVLTDSGCALTPEEGRKKGIYVLPLQVIDKDESFRDGVEITTMELYERLRKNHTPKTSMPILSDIEKVLQEIKDEGVQQIIVLPLSSGLSSTFNSIRMVATQLQLSVVNIENYTTCDLQAHSVFLAKQYVDEGMEVQALKKRLAALIQTSGTLILPNDIQHLKRGGRLTPLAAAAASLLKIKPILKIDPSTAGKIDVYDKVRTEKKAQQCAIDYISEKMNGKAGYVYVIHSDNEAKANEIAMELKKRNDKLQIRINYICAVIAAHTGLDCIAIQYIEKEK